MGRLPQGTTHRHGSGPQIDDPDRFTDALDDALGDVAGPETETILDLPSEPEKMMKVGPQPVNCSLGHSGELYVEASPDSIAAAGLFYADGEPVEVASVDPVEYKGTPWSRVTVEVSDESA